MAVPPAMRSTVTCVEVAGRWLTVTGTVTVPAPSEWVAV